MGDWGGKCRELWGAETPDSVGGFSCLPGESIVGQLGGGSFHNSSTRGHRSPRLAAGGGAQRAKPTSSGPPPTLLSRSSERQMSSQWDGGEGTGGRKIRFETSVLSR